MVTGGYWKATWRLLRRWKADRRSPAATNPEILDVGGHWEATSAAIRLWVTVQSSGTVLTTHEPSSQLIERITNS